MTETVPNGFSIEPFEVLASKGRFALICAPDVGRVTVDFDMRVFRGGIATTGRPASGGTYKGRGWRQALVNAAVRWLDDTR